MKPSKNYDFYRILPHGSLKGFSRSTYLECTETVAELDDMDETVEVVRGEDEAVSLLDLSPPPKHQVPSQAVLQGPGQVLVEDGIEIVVVSSWVPHLQHRDRRILTDLMIECHNANVFLEALNRLWESKI